MPHAEAGHKVTIAPIVLEAVIVTSCDNEHGVMFSHQCRRGDLVHTRSFYFHQTGQTNCGTEEK